MFELQNIGAEINIKVTSHLCDELEGIASCGVICCGQPVDLLQLDCYLKCNGKIIDACFGTFPTLQDLPYLLFLVYFPGPAMGWKKYVVNGFDKFGIGFRAHGSGAEVKKCGLHMVYRKEVQENCNRIKAERKKKALEYLDLAVTTERRKKQQHQSL